MNGEMDQVGALRDTVTLAGKYHLHDRPGTGISHLRGMLKTVEDNPDYFDPAKLGRWLGYAQGAVVAGTVLTLEDMKALNRAHIYTWPVRVDSPLDTDRAQELLARTEDQRHLTVIVSVDRDKFVEADSVADRYELVHAAAYDFGTPVNATMKLVGFAGKLMVEYTTNVAAALNLTFGVDHY